MAKKVKYPFRVLFSYLLLSIIGMALLGWLSKILNREDLLEGIEDYITAFVIFLAAFVVYSFVIFRLIVKGFFNSLSTNQAWRGGGLYNFFKTTLIICCFLSIIIVLYSGASYIFKKNTELIFYYKAISLLFIVLIPIPNAKFLKKKIVNNWCPKCESIHSIYLAENQCTKTGKTENILKKEKAHTDYKTQNYSVIVAEPEYEGSDTYVFREKTETEYYKEKVPEKTIITTYEINHIRKVWRCSVCGDEEVREYDTRGEKTKTKII